MRLCYGLFLAFIVACGGSSTGYSNNAPPPPGTPPPPPPPPGPAPIAVSIEDFSYAPDSIVVSAGTLVQWSNGGAYAHTVTSDNAVFTSTDLAGPGVDTYGNPTAGAKYSRTFATAGAFPYHCTHHPGMKGTVIVNP